MMTDPVADMLTRIRNAVLRGMPDVVMPSSKAKLAVAEVLVENHPVPMRIVGIPNMYLGSGDPYDLLKIAGLTSRNIADKLLEINST